MFNRENFKKVMDAIRANRNGWFQGGWHTVFIPKEDEKVVLSLKNVIEGEDGVNRCFRDPTPGECGTAHCVAGWAQVLAGHDQIIETIRGDAGAFLGLPIDGGVWLYGAGRTMEDLIAVERGELNPRSGLPLSGGEHL